MRCTRRSTARRRIASTFCRRGSSATAPHPARANAKRLARRSAFATRSRCCCLWAPASSRKAWTGRCADWRRCPKAWLGASPCSSSARTGRGGSSASPSASGSPPGCAFWAGATMCPRCSPRPMRASCRPTTKTRAPRSWRASSPASPCSRRRTAAMRPTLRRSKPEWSRRCPTTRRASTPTSCACSNPTSVRRGRTTGAGSPRTGASTACRRTPWTCWSGLQSATSRRWSSSTPSALPRATRATGTSCLSPWHWASAAWRCGSTRASGRALCRRKSIWCGCRWPR